MTWKDILKAPLSEREMAEVREFMPEEMEDRSIRTFRPITTPVKLPTVITPESELERRLQSFKNAPRGLQQRSALQLLRDAAERAGMPDAATAYPPEIEYFVKEMKAKNR
jgi:hypothetical protein